MAKVDRHTDSKPVGFFLLLFLLHFCDFFFLAFLLLGFFLNIRYSPSFFTICDVNTVTVDYVHSVMRGTRKKLTAMEAHSMTTTLRLHYPKLFAAPPGANISI
jgi:hypothetical protein